MSTFGLSSLYYQLFLRQGQATPEACVETIDSASGSRSKSCQ